MSSWFKLEYGKQRAFFFLVVACTYLVAIQTRLGVELADDGAFFLRYAENMLNGEFWVWNRGEAPIWGASAPLFPLAIALIMKMGVPAVPAMTWGSVGMAAIGLSLATTVLVQRVGIVAGLMFLFLSTFDTGLMYFSGAGLETPLTLILLALGVWAALGSPREWQVGLIAGALMVSKLDLVPVGGLLLIAQWMRFRVFPWRASAVAAAVALAWYGFAWSYFGAPVPNSFLTKSLHQSGMQATIDWTWFGKFVLTGTHAWSLALGLVGAALMKPIHRPVVVFLAGTLLVHLIAYTIKYPFEPYNWYAMPAVFSLLILAAMGMQSISDLVSSRTKAAQVLRVTIPLACVLLIAAVQVGAEHRNLASVHGFVSHQEHDRAEAGRWVAKNTPKDFRVYTMWGNPAYHSQRMVIDGSFLNRRFSAENQVAMYRPEILIMQNNPGSTPGAPVFANHVDRGYSVVKVFDKTYSMGMDYFFAVLARDDVLASVRNIERPRELMDYVSNSTPGDLHGLVKSLGSGSLFVHPGASKPTRFDFSLEGFAVHTKQPTAIVDAAIAENVPEDALKRGGANVQVRVLSGNSVLKQAVVSVGDPMRIVIDVAKNPNLSIVVDNNGSPDTDWLVFSVR